MKKFIAIGLFLYALIPSFASINEDLMPGGKFNPVGSAKPPTALSVSCAIQVDTVKQIIVHEKFLGESANDIRTNYQMSDELTALDIAWFNKMLDEVEALPPDTDWNKYIKNYVCLNG